MSDEPINPGFPDAFQDAKLMQHDQRLGAIERLLQPYSERRIGSLLDNGDVRIFDVLAKVGGTGGGLKVLPPLSPSFRLKDEKLVVSVIPHVFLTPDVGGRLLGIVPTLEGKPIDADPIPETALKDGKWFQILYVSPGKAKIEFAESIPSRPDRFETQEIVLLSEFDVIEQAVENLKNYAGALPLETRRPPGFAPLTWFNTETERWECKIVTGHIRDMRSADASTQDVNWFHEVKANDIAWLRIRCGADGDSPYGSVLIQEEADDPQDFKPDLSDQAPQSGEVWVKLFSFKLDEDRLYPKIEWQGDIPWWPQSFQNLGGDAELLSATGEQSGKLKVRGVSGGTSEEPTGSCIEEFQVMAEQRANDVLLRAFAPASWECIELKVCIDGYPQTKRFIVLPDAAEPEA